ncbi:MAG TPA: PqqD family protein [Planctomycetota bacterium]|nr:PqqD family protein [Planctomycetota bacterium]
MTSRWVRSSGVVWEDVNGEAVLVNTSARQTLVLNSTASFLWKCCDGSLSLQEIASRIAAAGGHKVEQVREELAHFCGELETRGLLLSASNAAMIPASEHAVCFSGGDFPPRIKLESSSLGFRGRPSPRGVSGQ